MCGWLHATHRGTICKYTYIYIHTHTNIHTCKYLRGYFSTKFPNSDTTRRTTGPHTHNLYVHICVHLYILNILTRVFLCQNLEHSSPQGPTHKKCIHIYAYKYTCIHTRIFLRGCFPATIRSTTWRATRPHYKTPTAKPTDD